MRVFLCNEVFIALVLEGRTAQERGEKVHKRKKLEEIGEVGDEELRRMRWPVDSCSRAANLSSRVRVFLCSRVVLFGRIAVVVVEGEGEELDGENHLRAGEVESPAEPVGVRSAGG